MSKPKPKAGQVTPFDESETEGSNGGTSASKFVFFLATTTQKKGKHLGFCGDLHSLIYMRCLGNIVHCGLRNGAIVSVDLRVRPDNLLTRHRIRRSQSSSKTSEKTTEEEFMLRGNINSSHGKETLKMALFTGHGLDRVKEYSTCFKRFTA
ncbi:hypothetical protein Bca52824_004934 [Brassica carinata]|uniref:Uncharacterized protein n=1 Tax=Brassica carinata TaxID=52824 RepID=A0A8X7WPY0_BRACI|nr:hypothetical protein Bca52824_004934 [Brassica carinata]